MNLDRLFADAMRAWHIPSAAVVVVRDGEIVFCNAYNCTVDSNFQLASATKTFTTTALAILVAEGRLGWNDPVRKHLDFFHLHDPFADEHVTLRDLLAHRTGLKRNDELGTKSTFTNDDLIRRLGKIPLAMLFRSGYQYQHITYIAAGEIVARVSGMSWADFIRTRILEPLGMTRTTCGTDTPVCGHRFDGTRAIEQRIGDDRIDPAASIRSNARELANFLRFHLDDPRFAETKTAQTPIRREGLWADANPHTTTIAAAMGWTVQDYRGAQLAWHAGSMNGFRVHLDLVPELRAGFAILTNIGRTLAVFALRNALLDFLLDEPFVDWNPHYLAIDESLRRARIRATPPPSEPTREIEGEYEHDAYGSASVHDQTLRWGRLVLPLTHFAHDTWRARDENEEVDELVTFGDGAMRFYEREFEKRRTTS
ncbi:MAG TPA: serine hydrolase [Thermoanaerobaculia bacterium]|nr:serine hydrolase [Thermoanaerobaculia bacterium]